MVKAPVMLVFPTTWNNPGTKFSTAFVPPAIVPSSSRTSPAPVPVAVPLIVVVVPLPVMSRLAPPETLIIGLVRTASARKFKFPPFTRTFPPVFTVSGTSTYSVPPSFSILPPPSTVTPTVGPPLRFRIEYPPVFAMKSPPLRILNSAVADVRSRYAFPIVISPETRSFPEIFGELFAIVTFPVTVTVPSSVDSPDITRFAIDAGFVEDKIPPSNKITSLPPTVRLFTVAPVVM